MNYEKFNDAMCKIRQVEEEFNKKLLEVFKPFTDEMNKQQKEDNEAYNKGLKDMRESMIYLYEHSEALYTLFKTGMMYYVLDEHNPQEIIDKTNQWKAEQEKKEQEIRVGDEIISKNENCSNYNKKFIYLGRNGQRNALCGLEDGDIQFITDLVNYKITGKHYNINF